MKKLMALFFLGVLLVTTSGTQDLFIGGKILASPFFGKLTVQDGAVTGELLLEATGKPLVVTGYTDENGKLTLKEVLEDSKTLQRFDGQWSGSRLKGRWIEGPASVPVDWSLLAVGGKKNLFLQSMIHMEQDVISFTKELGGWATLNPILYQWLQTVWSDFWAEWEKTDPKLDLPSFELYHRLYKSYMNGQLVSLVFTHFSYTGGAHGLGVSQSRNFQRVEGVWKPLGLSDLVSVQGGGVLGLIKIILKDLRTQGASWVVDGSVKDLTLKQLQRFYLGPDGLIFYFDPYELGPYAQGSLEVKLPWAQIKALLIPGVLKRLFPALMDG